MPISAITGVEVRCDERERAADRALVSAYLSGADLHGAFLSRADLRAAFLRLADLSRSDLTGADLMGADLRQTDLLDAFLIATNVVGADFRGARAAQLDGVRGTPRSRDIAH
jgi:uncharacterized protein YjbI with pentapeptide repeats